MATPTPAAHRMPVTLRSTLVVAVGLGLSTVVLVLVPASRIAVDSLEARVALEVAILGAMAAAAMLLAVLRSQPGILPAGRDAFVAALIVQGLANLAFGILPAIAAQPPTFARTFYPWLTGRYAAGALFLAAAIRLRPRRLRATVGVAVAAVGLVEVVVAAARPQLPLPPIVAPGQIAPVGIHVLLEAGPLLLFALGAYVAGRYAEQTGEPLERWLSLALFVGVFTQVHQALFPAALGEVITSADVLRAGSAALLLVGAIQQVVRLQSQRNRAVELLQQDLARNRRLLEDVREAREREAAFSSVVTHELSSPLAAINARVHVLDAIAGDELHPHVDAMRAEAERLGALVRRMEELRSLEQEDFAVDLRAVAAASLLEEVASFTRGLHGGHRVALDATQARILADPVRLGQVLRNVTANAARHAGTDIRITGRVDDDRYVVVVADDGPGVSGEDIDSLFDAYVRGRRATEDGGTGLGLHLARRILDAHGGTISFVDPEGAGARVRIDVRLAG